MTLRIVFILAILVVISFFAYNHPSSLTLIRTPALQEGPPETATDSSPAEKDAASTTTPPGSQPITLKPRSLLEEQEEPPIPASSTTNIAPPAQAVKERIPQETLFNRAEERVVNFFCDSGRREVVVATGVIVSAQGHIITNAHIAEDITTDTCLVRLGSPAEDFAYARKMFLPTTYSATSTELENLRKDVSIWKIVRLVDGATLPSSFPFFEINPAVKSQPGDPLATFSYPAELLSSQVIMNYLYLTFSETTVLQVDRYLIESFHGLGSQQGSSGGILVDPYAGTFTGLIFGISGNSQNVSDRKMYSITPLAIDQVVLEETGAHLQEYLQKN